jgi:hypothetical protein
MARPKLPQVSLLETDVLTCKYCGITTTVNNFVRKRRTRLGYLRVCKACHSKDVCTRLARRLKLYPELREIKNQKHRDRYKIDPKFRQRCLDISKKCRRKNHLKTKFGLTLDDVANMRKQQNNKCAICFVSFDETPCIDHNHTTGQVRGLICASCNLGLGKFKDNSMLLLQAAQYLRKYETIDAED